MTHAEFEDEPVEAVRWMLEIDHLHAQAKRDRQRAQQQPGGGGK